MKKYYIERNRHYFNSPVLSGRALMNETICEQDLIDSLFTQDPSQMKVFNSVAIAKYHLRWVTGCKIMEIITNSGETSSIHREVCEECFGSGVVGSDPWGKRFSDEWHPCECQPTEPPTFTS